MLKKIVFSFFFITIISIANSCKTTTRLDGVHYFYDNYRDYKICLGEGYGCHSISLVEKKGTQLAIKYTYRDGVLMGEIDENGDFYGEYSTFTSDGDFYMRFEPDGTAYGSWKTTSSPVEFSGCMSLEK